MMKKLAVTVFVLSLTAVGCGSDNGTPAKKDSAPPDTKVTDTATQPDAPPVNGPEVGKDVAVGPEVTADKPVTEEVTQPVEVGPVDVQPGEAQPPVDVAPVDVSKDVPPPPLDVRTPDVPPSEAAPPVVDGGVDGRSVG
jgi:hypothetical protein